MTDNPSFPASQAAPGEKTVFLCEDTPDGIFTAVYDAWGSRLGHRNVALQLNGSYNFSLFCRYVTVRTDYEKAWKVARSVKNKLSGPVYDMAYRACLSPSQEKADAVYRFLVLAFHYGPKIVSMLGLSQVQEIFALHRAVSNEAHYFREFLRFSSLDNEILYAKICPKSNVLPLLSPHFADRLPALPWVILDETHGLASFHAPEQEWVLMPVQAVDMEKLCQYADSEDQYRSLWKIFHKTISIQERTNPRCQMTHLPLWYRKNMTEF